jgi:hypothetical protein
MLTDVPTSYGYLMLERRLASSEPGNNHSNTEVGSAAPDPLLDGLLSYISSTQTGSIQEVIAAVSVLGMSLIIKKPHRFRRPTRLPAVGLYRYH